MERWEYAAGYADTRSVDDAWTNNSDPTTFEQAMRDFAHMIAEHGDESWVIDPCVVKRSDRYPDWAKVEDHAAELLAEALADLALRFAANGNDIMQGKDLSRILKRVAQGLKPDNVEEYDL